MAQCPPLKLKFHWDQFPRNFPVANVTGKSPTSYEEVGRVASLLRGSYEEAGDVANKSARRGNWSQWNLSLNVDEVEVSTKSNEYTLVESERTLVSK